MRSTLRGVLAVGILSVMLGGLPEVAQSGACEDTRVEDDLAALIEANGVDGSGWRVDVQVHEDDDAQFVASVDIEDPQGHRAHRTVSSQSCEVATEAVAFMVATALAEPGGLPAPEPEPEVELEPEPEPEPEVVPEPSPSDDVAPPPSPTAEEPLGKPLPVLTRPARRVYGWVGTSVGVMGGALPGVAGRLRLGGGLEGSLWRVALGLSASSRPDATAQAVDTVGASIGHWAVDARGCGVVRRGRWSVPLCGGAEVGQLYASGFGFSGARTITLPWGAGLASAGLGVALGKRWRVTLDATLGVVLNRAEIVVDNLESLHTLGPVFGRGAVGVELRI